MEKQQESITLRNKCSDAGLYFGASIIRDDIRFPQPIRGVDSTRGAYVEGHIEIYHNGVWGTICDDEFDQNNNGARVLCRMMNYADGAESDSYRQPHVTPSAMQWLDNVKCSGA